MTISVTLSAEAPAPPPPVETKFTSTVSVSVTLTEPEPEPEPEPLPDDLVLTGFEDADETVTIEKKETTDGADEDLYEVTFTTTDGETKTYELSEEQLAQATISTGDGSDTVHVGEDVDVGLTIDTGSGDDVVYGGSGADSIYGGSGHDVIYGGGGDDVIHGGTGADAVYAEDASQVYTGGKSSADDTSETSGDDGNDDFVVAVGESVTVDSGDRDATATVSEQNIADAEAWLADYGNVEGSHGFKQRLTADIAVMFSTEQGTGLLTDLGDTLAKDGSKVNFRSDTGVTSYYDPENNDVVISQNMNVLGDGSLFAPAVSTFHELVHAWQFTTENSVLDKSDGGITSRGFAATSYESGRIIPNLEAAAVGLPWYDTDGNLREQPDPDHPYSTNQFRAELGLQPRTDYGPSSFLHDSNFFEDIGAPIHPDDAEVPDLLGGVSDNSGIVSDDEVITF